MKLPFRLKHTDGKKSSPTKFFGGLLSKKGKRSLGGLLDKLGPLSGLGGIAAKHMLGEEGRGGRGSAREAMMGARAQHRRKFGTGGGSRPTAQVAGGARERNTALIDALERQDEANAELEALKNESEL